jgi:zinc protease
MTSAFVDRTLRRVAPGGAVLLALENHFNPTIALSGALRAGPVHAPADNPIVASLTAHMLEKGTRRRSKLEIAEELESRGIGISFSASGGDPDLLDISVTSLSRDAGIAVGALVEMLREPVFPAEELEKEKERLAGSVRQLADQTGWRASTAASRRLYAPGHPYFARSAEEILEALSRTTRDELVRFHRAHYGSAGLVIAAVGDLDREAFTDDLARRIEGFAADAPLSELAVPSPRPSAAGREIVMMKDKVNADVVLCRDGGLRKADPDFLATALGISALGQSTLSSRLGLRVRDTLGLTYGINARIAAGRFAGPFSISLTVAPENLTKAVDAARAVLSEFLETGITEAEMTSEKRSRIGKFKVDLASNAGIAGALESAESYGFGVSYLDEMPARVDRIPREEINEAVARHIRVDDLVEVAAGSFPPEAAPGSA